jgi:hypothetical protein
VHFLDRVRLKIYRRVNRFLFLSIFRFVFKPPADSVLVGSEYGNWRLPHNFSDVLKFTATYSNLIITGGVGEDISFELIASCEYNLKILLYDFTERSSLFIDKQKEKWPLILSEDGCFLAGAHFPSLTFVQKGISSGGGIIYCNPPLNPSHVSFSYSRTQIKSATNCTFDSESLSSILGTIAPPLILKLDIEGAEHDLIVNDSLLLFKPLITLIELDCLKSITPFESLNVLISLARASRSANSKCFYMNDYNIGFSK